MRGGGLGSLKLLARIIGARPADGGNGAGVTSGSTRRAGSGLSQNDTQSFCSAECDAAHYPKFGFTLAEVLITLGIIGIVAAMTLPALVQNYQKQVIKEQFKKSYNTASNAYKMAEAVLGFPPQCYYGWDNYGAPCLERDEQGNCIKYGEDVNPTNQTSDCAILKKTLKKTYKIAKICEGNALEQGCIPEYKGNDTIYKESNDTDDDYAANVATSGCSGWRESPIHNDREVWDLVDGTIILWYSDKLFALDVNGMKRPNKWGYDLFPFMVYKHKSGALKLQPGGCQITDKGGVSTSQMLYEIYK